LCGLEGLRLAALVHEEPPGSLTKLLDSAGLFDLAPIVVAVTGGFGRLWKVRTEGNLRDYGEVHRPHLIRATTPGEIRARFAEDPWAGNDLLRITRVPPWTLRLGSLG
jgi:hypothetical protein